MRVLSDGENDNWLSDMVGLYANTQQTRMVRYTRPKEEPDSSSPSGGAARLHSGSWQLRRGHIMDAKPFK